MLKMRVPTLADIQNFKFHFTEAKIQKLKTAFRKFVGYSVIISILGVDLAYAMNEEENLGSKTPYRRLSDSDTTAGGARGHQNRYEVFNGEGEVEAEESNLNRETSRGYVAPPLVLPTNQDTTEPSNPFREGRGSPPSADSFSSSSSEETEISPRDRTLSSGDSSGENGSPETSRPPSPTKLVSSGEGSGSEEDIELTDMSSSKMPQDEEALTEEKELSLSEIKKQMLENIPLWDPSDLDNIEFAEPKKGWWGKAWDRVTSPCAGAWDCVTSPFKTAWDYVGSCLDEPTEKLKDKVAEKTKGYSELGEKAQPLLPEESDGLMEKVRALAKAIKGTSLEDFAVHFKKQIIDQTWRWYQWAMLFPAFVMGGGTGNAIAAIIVTTIFNNEYLGSVNQNYYDYVTDLSYYIAVSTSLFVFTDAASFLTKATSPTRKFSAPISWKEWFATKFFGSFAIPQNLFLAVLLWKLEQHAKEATDTTNWWNPYDQFFYFTATGLVAYCIVSPYLRMRGAIRHHLHGDIPSHVQDRVMALDGFKERVRYNLSDTEVIELYNYLKDPFFPEHTSQFKEWVNYLIRGKISTLEVVGSSLKYTYLTKRARAEMEKEPQTLHKHKIERIVPKILTIDSFAQGALGLFAGFSITAGSFYDLLFDYIGWEGALATGLTLATLTFLASGYLQSHSFKETLEDIWEKVSPYHTGKVHFKNTLKNGWAWGRGVLKGLVYLYATGQNTLTNVAAEFALLVFIIPKYFGGDDNTQLGITIGMGVLSSPHLFTEMVNGTRDIGGAVLKIYRNGRRIFHTITFHYYMTVRQMRLEVVHIVGDLEDITRKFSREHVKNLGVIERWFIKNNPTKLNPISLKTFHTERKNTTQ